VWDCAKSHESLGRFYSRKQRFLEAEMQFRTAISREPGRSSVHAHLGEVLYSTGAAQDDGAAEYERAVQLDPNNDEAYSDWGDDLQKSGDFESAAEKYQQALAINPYRNVGFDL